MPHRFAVLSRITGTSAAPKGSSALHWFRCVVALIAAVPAVAAAQVVARPAGDDALRLSPPRLSLTIRGGYDRPIGSSRIFAFSTRNLTLDDGDFASGGYQADLGIRLSERLQLVASSGSATRRVESEFRDFIDNNDQPIEQTTRLRRLPVTLGLKYALTSPGEQIGSYIWIPSRITTWIGAGGGMMNYTFSQIGDFVDFQSLNVFRQTLTAGGWTPMAYANVGADLRVNDHVSLTGDIRYSAAQAKLSGSYYGFDRVDLSGTAATMGFTLRR